MKDDLLYLRHILEAIDRIQAYTAGGPDAFQNHLPPLREKVLRALPEG